VGDLASALVQMFVFIAILLVGYVYAWKKGVFEWE
jgi:NADH:ubiquinone oxidoreductase subunit 3 (subunit A)